MKLLLSACLLSLTLYFSTNAQGFPWNDFKPRTLSDIVAMDKEEINLSENRHQLIAHADPLFSVVRVKYAGKSRPMSAVKMDLLKSYWAKLFAQDSDKYSGLYENDFLFTEKGIEYWLPVQKQVSAYFPKELKEGDDIDIYIVRAGGVCIKKQCDWLFLVEEYKKLGTSP